MVIKENSKDLTETKEPDANEASSAKSDPSPSLML